MRDQDLDQVIQKWADDETASAPKLRPTAEMYECIEALGNRRSLGPLWTRRPAWTVALAVVVALAIALAVVQVGPRVWPGRGRQVARVPVRVAFAAAKGEPRVAPPPGGKGVRGGALPFLQLLFQVRGAESSEMRSVDLLAPHGQDTLLAADDSYRLALELAAERYVYVYLETPGEALARLYPDRAYSPVQNPMPVSQPVYLPAEPDGFYLDGAVGLYRITVVAAKSPDTELEALYEQYSRRGLRFNRRQDLALVQRRLDLIARGEVEGAVGKVFEFEVR
jgi:hypothetical protein